jgi:hypothetical protein
MRIEAEESNSIARIDAARAQYAGQARNTTTDLRPGEARRTVNERNFVAPNGNCAH